MNTTQTNALATETSPYLLQHAHHPVDWYPWGEQALQRAREEQKPILLSIGYAACHWCHVMAHESFADSATAAIMNRSFINIKVDREERPDLDKIYQLAHQVLTERSGGWPLTVWLTHDDHQPFFAGTYFPPTARQGLPAFSDVLLKIAAHYNDNLGAIRQQNNALMQFFTQMLPTTAGDTQLNDAPLIQARHHLTQQFDREFGGLGGAPKFPHVRTLEFLLRQWHASHRTAQPDLHALYLCTLSLTRMAEGGLYDQLGGGFFRYTVDRYWQIPHFEKMLYDNAELLRIYTDAAAATGESLFKRIALETAAWICRDLHTTAGGYAAAFDADSEGHEGRFYVWDAQAIQTALSAPEYAVCQQYFGLTQAANFEGQWHLHIARPLNDIAAELNIDLQDAQTLLTQARATLLQLRSQRSWPQRDEKILTAWNGLTLSALARAARTFAAASLLTAAQATLTCIRTQLWQQNRLLATYTAGRAHLPAYLDDYAFLLDGLLEMLQTQWRDADLDFATTLADSLLLYFNDPVQGGFFFTAHDHEPLIHRPKSFADEALPAGNAIAIRALTLLGHLLGEARYLAAAEQALRNAWQDITTFPAVHASLLNALDDYLNPPQFIILRGATAAREHWQQTLNRLYLPKCLVFSIPDDASLPITLAAKQSHPDPVAYVCRGSVCSEPVHTLNELLNLVSAD